MKKSLLLIFVLLLTLNLFATTAQEYIESAQALEESDVFQAIKVMEEAADEFPNNADILSFYGLLVSKGAGQVNFLKAGGMASKAEKIFAQALLIQPKHKKALLGRGILRVNVPKFLGKLDQGIADLEEALALSEIASEDYLVGSYFLGSGYLKQENTAKAKHFFQIIVDYGPGYPFYEDSLQQLEELTGRE